VKRPTDLGPFAIDPQQAMPTNEGIPDASGLFAHRAAVMKATHDEATAFGRATGSGSAVPASWSAQNRRFRGRGPLSNRRAVTETDFRQVPLHAEHWKAGAPVRSRQPEALFVTVGVHGPFKGPS